MNARQIRLLVISVVSIIVIITLYSSSAPNYNFTNGIIDSTNNDKLDEQINNEIGKSQKNEENVQENKEVDEAEEAEDLLFDPVKELIQIRAVSPMVVFSKSYCPYSKRLKKLLADNYEITPMYAVVELDKHKHGKQLQEYLSTISGRSTVPNVLIGDSNASKGGCDDFLNLHESGKLVGLLNDWGNKKLSVKKIDAPSNL
ncbi:monothiol glutaredoxin-7 [[Candida] jaroonii]|uniref:Monothiol glutaredoxin-7 n=1 Tax=[Candida] jaroonii TaxID=467808 RepID=A0ACA9Y2G8_9ASCO|nr:monothiol glutaredoxin-7 [[Candida] jaroonii]